MLFFDRSLAPWHYLLAGILAVLLPMLLGLLLSVTLAAGCYDSLCLLPLLLLVTPVYGAPVLVAAFALNRRLGRPLPDGWLPVLAASGLLGQGAISAFALGTASDGMREIFFSDLLSVPQGFATGLAVGAAFWVPLYALGRRRGPGMRSDRE